MVDKGDDEIFWGFENDHKSFSKCVFWVGLYVGVVGLHWECTLIIGEFEELQ